jgi:hypothetical protein
MVNKIIIFRTVGVLKRPLVTVYPLASRMSMRMKSVCAIASKKRPIKAQPPVKIPLDENCPYSDKVNKYEKN